MKYLEVPAAGIVRSGTTASATTSRLVVAAAFSVPSLIVVNHVAINADRSCFKASARPPLSL